MKKLLFAIPLAALFLTSCQPAEDNALEDLLQDKDDFDAASDDFGKGKAQDGEQYFFGLLAEVIEVDVAMREVETMDEMDASEDKIKNVLDSCLIQIADAKKAMNLYKDKDWPKRAEFHDLTLEWFRHAETLIKDYLLPLAEPMSRGDETWSDDEMDLYEAYLEAYDKYLEVDERWVEFQYVYVEANGFQLSNETIDVDALVDQDLSDL